MADTIREVYGQKLLQLGKENPDIVVFDADVSSSTRTAAFGEEFPERFFNMGIAEANMTATAAGISTTGKIPYVNTFSVFMTTAGLLSIRSLICYGRLNVKLAGGYCGLSDAYDGASHHGVEDIAIMRTMPNMKILVPCDAASTRILTERAAELDGPVYLRLSRDYYPDLYSDSDTLPKEGATVLREGRDACVFACGIMVHKALAAADQLEKEGISIGVIDMFSIKPIHESLVEKVASKCGFIISAEEHSVIGGLGSAIAEVITRKGLNARQHFIGVQDCFSESGAYSDLLEKYGLDEKAICKAVKAGLARTEI